MASHIARSLALLILVETACCFYADVGVRGLRSIQPGAAKAIRATSKPVVAKSMIAAGSSSVATAGPALADADEELRHLVDGDRARRQLRHRSPIVFRLVARVIKEIVRLSFPCPACRAPSYTL